MNELRDELHHDELHNAEQLTTTNFVNRARNRPSISEAEMAEDATSFPSSRSSAANGARDLQPVTAAGVSAQPNPLFAEDELQSFRSRWSEVQTSFVDEPREAVELADNLVANVIERVAEQFAAERADLEKQWDSGEQADTENLRLALKRYRAFFDRLLAF